MTSKSEHKTEPSEQGSPASRFATTDARSDFLSLEKFRRQIVMVTVVLATVVSTTATIVSFRLGNHLAREREAWALARHINPDDNVHINSDLLPAGGYESRDLRGPSFERDLSPVRRVVWGYNLEKPGFVWARLEEAGEVVRIATSPISQPNPTLFRSAVVRAIIGAGLLAWLAFWGGIMLTNRVMSRLNAASEHLIRMATRDMLTGLINRHEFESRVEAVIKDQPRGWVMMLDLNSFKEVNDTLGHDVGDQILRVVASRLRDVIDDADFIARFGGDEFAAYLHTSSEEEAMATAYQICREIEKVIQVGEANISVGSSVGLCDCAQYATTVVEAISRADSAMYMTKKVKGDPVAYSPATDPHGLDRIALRFDLQNAIEEQEITLHYQPKKCVRTQKWVAVEALARWNHPVRGFVSPAEFIDLAERTGLIHRLTRHVINVAADQALRFQQLGIDCPIALNISHLSFSNADIVESLVAPLMQRNLPMRAFELELTETAAINDHGRTILLLRQISDFGVVINLDDFGTGMSSLSYLNNLPVDVVKIDRSFIMHLGNDPDSPDSRVVEAIIALTHSLGRTVVAEGVENAAAEDRLSELGCEFLQGYHIQRPVSGDEIERLLLTHGVHLDKPAQSP